MTEATQAKPSQAVLDAVALLEAFEQDTGEKTLAEIGRAAGVPKASALRHLKALALTGYVIHDPARKTYALGPAILTLAERFIAQQPSVHACRPVLAALARETGETAHYAVLQGRDVVYLDIAESPRRIRAYVSRGDRQPAHCMASGKAILAHSHAAVVDAFVDAGLVRLTDRTITSGSALRAELAAIRTRGYGLNLSEWMDDVGAAAAPIFSGSGQVVGAIGVAAPISRLNGANAEEVGGIVRACAARFTDMLAGRAA
ncbi:MAG: IclR family transcriptional regulator [Hyphomicrobiales bacterium]